MWCPNNYLVYYFVTLISFELFSNDTEYQLWLRNDLYTNKHTQWYYFRVQNTRPAIKYKFTIMNLHKVREQNSFKHSPTALQHTCMGHPAAGPFLMVHMLFTVSDKR